MKWVNISICMSGNVYERKDFDEGLEKQDQIALIKLYNWLLGSKNVKDESSKNWLVKSIYYVVLVFGICRVVELNRLNVL